MPESKYDSTSLNEPDRWSGSWAWFPRAAHRVRGCVVVGVVASRFVDCIIRLIFAGRLPHVQLKHVGV